MRRNLAFYLAVLILFGGGTWLVLATGGQIAGVASAPAPETASIEDGRLPDSSRAPLSVLLFQILVIVAAARLLGRVARWLGQPAVMGEMLAGILLGPSFLGLVAPGMHGWLFPAASLGTLSLLAQIGVVLYLFVVGIEVEVDHLRSRAEAALLVSHASILVPFFLGSACAIFLYRTYTPAGVPFPAFALFLGIAMSITAFPVLARILEERNLTGSPLGTTAITAAALGDVTAWCLLVFVVAIVRGGGLAASAWTVLLTAGFIGVMLLLVRPLVERRIRGRSIDGASGSVVVAATVCFAFAAALTTEAIGIHALFGAFLAGVCLPSSPGLRRVLRERLEPFGSVLLLPLFFALTGLRTRVGLLDEAGSWLVCAGIVLVATAGKVGGAMLGARMTGMGWGDAFSLGALMNTRGLVELIVLAVGYDLGILSPEIFTMLVLMALVTTFMTGPLLALRERKSQARHVPERVASAK
jgi:Kef-type K+ transport system membrane component KefB